MAVDLSSSRRTLPAPMLDRSSYSIFSVIKQAIGKDLTRFCVPVVWNEPLSLLQRLAETLEYSHLLDQAALASTSTERLHLITAFIASTLSTHLERMSKPFNPLLGETYELKMSGDAPFHYVAEQVSHHPPISAIHARGQLWTISANVEPKIKFHGTNVTGVSEGRWVLRLKKKPTMSRSTSQTSFQSCDEEDGNIPENDMEEEEYIWSSPSLLVHNILFGRLWCEFQGQIEINHVQSSRRSVLTIKSCSWFASQATKTAELFKFSGFIYDGPEKIGAYHGNYGHCYYAIDDINDAQIKSSNPCSAGGHNCILLHSTPYVSLPCDLLLTPSSRLIWHRSLSSMTEEELSSRSDYYFFDSFVMCLNEPTTNLVLPPTDCRFRQDIRFLERGETTEASDEKHRLEEQQRAEAKKREDDFQPLWFKKNEDNEEYSYTYDYEQRRFEHCPHLFSVPS